MRVVGGGEKDRIGSRKKRSGCGGENERRERNVNDESYENKRKEEKAPQKKEKRKKGKEFYDAVAMYDVQKAVGIDIELG